MGGDCEPTPGHAIMLEDGRLLFRPAKAAKLDGDGGFAKSGYESLMSEPGDGLVTRSSQTARRPLGLGGNGDGFHMLPTQGSFFLCESHGRLTHNLFFQDNLLYFLLSR